MKIIFVGAGASNLFASILLKRKYPDFDIAVIEKNKDVGKKLLMTGNGKCNLSPMPGEYFEKYNQPYFVKDLFDDVSDDEFVETLSLLGIKSKYIQSRGLYPFSEQAKNIVEILKSHLYQMKIELINDEITDYRINDKITLIGNEDRYCCDNVIFATGGKSYPKTGSDWSLMTTFEKHGYKINNLCPVLCPIKVYENVHKLFGVKVKGQVKLISNGKVIACESGEINFKDDGLSGICVMNLTRYIQSGQECMLSLNLLNCGDKTISKEDFLKNSGDLQSILYSYLPIKLSNYISDRFEKSSKNNLSLNEKEKLYSLITNFQFKVKSLYGFDDAQITRGGISLLHINHDFSSKKEKGVYFLGEMLDVDGPCGGYNLRFCISSAIGMVKHFVLNKFS